MKNDMENRESLVREIQGLKAMANEYVAVKDVAPFDACLDYLAEYVAEKPDLVRPGVRRA